MDTSKAPFVYKENNIALERTIWVKQGFAKYQSIKNEREQPDHTVDTITELLTIFED